MPEHPIDLRPLDPDDALDAGGAEQAFVSRVMAGVERQAGLYPLRADPLSAIWSLARPMLLAASIVLAAAATLFLNGRAEAARPPMTVAAAVGVPPMFLARPTDGLR
ncbi:MAG: hypothetical protein ABIY52_13835 [Gemmatimonadaceae bacterium]